MKLKFLLFFAMATWISTGLMAQQMTSIESVEYDPINQRFLVSNGSNVIVVDGDGNEVDYFANDPEADYGMEVMGNALYAIVGTAVKAFDLTSGMEVSSITITGAQFLNGMASDGDHRIWVTDFSAKKIYEIDFTDLANPAYTLVVSNTTTTPNGICYDETNNRLVFVNWGTNAAIKTVDLSDYTLGIVVANTGLSNIDGIDNDSYGNYYICSWTPNQVKKYNSDFSLTEVITVSGLSSPADLCYAEEIDTLAIPCSGNQTVKFVGFTVDHVEATEENPFAFECYPNPVVESSVLYFTLTEAGMTTIDILDMQGRVVSTVLEENLPAAKHKFVPGELDIASGHYLWRMTNGSSVYSVPFVK